MHSSVKHGIICPRCDTGGVFVNKNTTDKKYNYDCTLCNIDFNEDGTFEPYWLVSNAYFGYYDYVFGLHIKFKHSGTYVSDSIYFVPYRNGLRSIEKNNAAANMVYDIKDFFDKSGVKNTQELIGRKARIKFEGFKILSFEILPK